MRAALAAVVCVGCATQPPPPVVTGPAVVRDGPVHGAPAAEAPLCVTHGEMARGHVRAAAMRAFARGTRGDAGALEFTYDGRTKETSTLASGAVREQIALKLRAQDGCNLVYVSWRFSPKAEVVVQVKQNPGERTNAECGNRGYETVKPGWRGDVSVPAPGSTHRLEAEIRGDELAASIDGAVVWKGTLPEGARALHGPVGVRTDNVEATVAVSGPKAERADEPECKPGQGGD